MFEVVYLDHSTKNNQFCIEKFYEAENAWQFAQGISELFLNATITYNDEIIGVFYKGIPHCYTHSEFIEKTKESE